MMRSTTIVAALCGATGCTGDIGSDGRAAIGDRRGEAASAVTPSAGGMDTAGAPGGTGGAGAAAARGGPSQPEMAPDVFSAGRLPDPGRSPVRRLTRFEYNNTVRDLLGDKTRPADQFPGDRAKTGLAATLMLRESRKTTIGPRLRGNTNIANAPVRIMLQPPHSFAADATSVRSAIVGESLQSPLIRAVHTYCGRHGHEYGGFRRISLSLSGRVAEFAIFAGPKLLRWFS